MYCPALVVPHGFTARMFLRSTLLPELLQRCEHVGIFAPPSAIPRFRGELPGDRFSFFPLNDRERKVDTAAAFGRLFFADWKLTPTREIREQEEWAKNRLRRALWPAHTVLGRSAALRRAWYEAENRLLPDPFHGKAFRKLDPDVVVTATARGGGQRRPADPAGAGGRGAVRDVHPGLGQPDLEDDHRRPAGSADRLERADAGGGRRTARLPRGPDRRDRAAALRPVLPSNRLDGPRRRSCARWGWTRRSGSSSTRPARSGTSRTASP